MTLRGISEDVQKKLETQLWIELDESVRACEDRNQILFRWDAQLRSDPYWAGIKPRWRGGSDIESTLTREHHIGVVANITSVMRQEQWWVVNETAPGDEDDASDLEAWLNDKVAQYALSGKIAYDLAYNAGRHTYGILYCGWKEEYKTTFETVYVDQDTQEEVDPEGRIPGRTYKEKELVHEEVANAGLDFSVPHGSDVYLMPANAQTVQRADRIAERMYFSANELWDGITDFGFDLDAVTKILAGGPAAGDGSTYKKESDDRDGIRPNDEGLYECFMIVGRQPFILEDGEPVLKEDERRRDYIWYIEKASGTVFKCTPSKYKRRPYVKFPFLGEPGRWMGDGVCSLVSGLHREDTISQRFRIDVRDLTMSPVRIVPSTMYEEYSRFSFYPGAVFPYEPGSMGPDNVKSFDWDKSGFGAALQDSEDLQFRAARMFSAQARGTVSTQNGQPRTATEIQNAAQGADEKFDLILTNFHIGVEELADVIISHYQQFQPDEEISVGSRVISMSPELLEKRFRIQAYGSSENANPQLRLMRAEKIFEFISQNPLVIQAMQAGDLTGIWAVSAKILRDLGWRDPQTVLGMEPSKPPTPDMILQVILPMIMQFAQAGDPGAQQIMMALQQIAQQGQQQPMAQPAGDLAGLMGAVIPQQQQMAIAA